jgi:glycosyltransferase involved in cell wall biosynthesis
MRIVITRSNPVAPDPRVLKTALALQADGHETVVVGWDRTGQLPNPECLDGIIIHRLQIPASYGRGLANLIPLLRWEWGLLRWLYSHRNNFDTIHACDFDTVLPACIIKTLMGKRVVYDIFDFYADHLRATPGWIKSLIRKVDLHIIGRVDGVILVDEIRRAQIAGSHPKRLAVIYNVPQDVFGLGQKAERSPARAQKLHIAFVGLLQHERGIFQLLDVMRKHPEWALDLAGFGGDAEQVEAYALHSRNIRFLGRIEYEQALQLYRETDVIVATYDPTIANHKYASPNKLFEAMMLAKPIVVAGATGMDEIVTQERCGLVVNYGDIDSLDKALSQLEADPVLRKRLGLAGRAAYEQRYSWAEQRARLILFYSQLS